MNLIISKSALNMIGIILIKFFQLNYFKKSIAIKTFKVENQNKYC